MSNPEPQNLSRGFVSWIDVLGFKQILRSGQGTDATESKVDVWLKVFSALRKVREQQFEHELTDFLRTKRGLCDSAYNSTAFTDSIVLSVDLSQASQSDFDQWCLETLFLRRTAFLTRLMFEEGLPIRGGIAYGDFMHNEQGFAGDPFVEAEALSARLELSACVFTRGAIKRIQELLQSQNPWANIEQNYQWFLHDKCAFKPETKSMQCGLKDKTTAPVCPLEQMPVLEPVYALNFASRGTLRATDDASEFKIDFSASDADLHQIVTKSFSDHGKPIDDKRGTIKAKIQATVTMLEAARAAAPGLFS